MRFGLLLVCWMARAAILVPAPSERPAPSLRDLLLNCAGNQKEKLSKLAQRGVPHLAKLLESKDRITRISAIVALAEARDDPQGAARILAERCKGSDTDDAHFALIALARRRAPQAKALIETFCKDTHPRRREAACFAIVELRDPSLYARLDALRTDPTRRVQHAARAAKAILGRARRR